MSQNELKIDCRPINFFMFNLIWSKNGANGSFSHAVLCTFEKNGWFYQMVVVLLKYIKFQ